MKIFRQEIYLPLLREAELSSKLLKNSLDDLLEAIQSRRIYYSKGSFRGRFNSTLTRELRDLGAQWDSKQGSWRIPLSKIPMRVKMSISLSEARLDSTMEKIQRKIEKIVPAEIAEKVSLEKHFDTTLWKSEQEFQKNVRNITVAPKVTPEERSRIAKEYTNNVQLYIRDFTEKETEELRKNVIKATFSGERYENMIGAIKQSYGVSQRKAKFLARQESSLMVTKYTQARYESAGSTEYDWQCVSGSPNHPVRPMHKKLNNTRQS